MVGFASRGLDGRVSCAERDTGHRFSVLDEIHPTRWTAQFTRELLKPLCVLGATVERQPNLAELLAQIIAGPTIPTADLPQPTTAKRPPLESGEKLHPDFSHGLISDSSLGLFIGAVALRRFVV